MSEASDESLFIDLYNDYQTSILRYLYQCLSSMSAAERYQVAEDLTQETFLSAYANWPVFEGKDQPHRIRAWLYTIAKNKLKDRLRRHKLIVWHSLEEAGLPAEERDVFDPQQAFVDGEPLRRALSRLPTQQQNALLLHYRDGYSYQEVAQQLGCSVSKIKMLLFYARERFHDYYHYYQNGVSEDHDH